MNAQTFLLYLATWSLVALTPGPAVMCAMSLATRFGLRSSFAGIVGIQVGHLVFFACTALGLATLLATATTAFTILRVLGAVYLVYLGVRIIISSLRSRKAIVSQRPPTPPARRNLLLQGLAIQLTNPKALLFVSALLPQFIDPRRPLLVQVAILTVTTIVVDVLVLSAYACVAERGRKSLRDSGFSAWLERVFGAALVFFGFRLLASRK
jgi:threonine/homoserine/homoserine lactone efflux protein